MAYGDINDGELGDLGCCETSSYDARSTLPDYDDASVRNELMGAFLHIQGGGSTGLIRVAEVKNLCTAPAAVDALIQNGVFAVFTDSEGQLWVDLADCTKKLADLPGRKKRRGVDEGRANFRVEVGGVLDMIEWEIPLASPNL